MKILLFVLNLLCISGYGQDYLVTHKGDTLLGELKLLSYDRLDRVQISQNKEKKIFTAIQVKGIYFKGESFRPLKRENTIRFMKLLKPGYLSLYAFQMEGQTSYDGRYLAKQDGAVMEVPNLTFKKSMASFLIDCRSVREKLEKGEYSKRNIDQIIDDFNACMDGNSQALMKAGAAASEAKQKSLPLEELRKTLEGLSDFTARKDALDLINDMISKINSAQAIPNYQLDALKGYLQGNEATKQGLEKFLDSLKN